MHLENIVYLVGRADSLGCMFFIMGCNCISMDNSKAAGVNNRKLSSIMNLKFLKEACIVVLFAVCGGLCKETAFTMPVMVAFIKFIQKKEIHAATYLVLFCIIYALR